MYFFYVSMWPNMCKQFESDRNTAAVTLWYLCLNLPLSFPPSAVRPKQRSLKKKEKSKNKHWTVSNLKRSPRKDTFLTSTLFLPMSTFLWGTPPWHFFSQTTNLNRLTGCEKDSRMNRRLLECAGCGGTKGGGGEVSPLLRCIKPIEKSVSQEDQISANPPSRETQRKHKSAPLQAESSQEPRRSAWLLLLDCLLKGP